MRVTPLHFLLLAGLVSGCAAEEPFVDQGTTVTVQKNPNTAAHKGLVDICHSDKTPWSQVLALAEEQCAAHGLKPMLFETQRWQCRATSPHQSNFRCVDPGMRNEDGTYVNPFNRGAVASWEQRTGKTAPAYGVTRNPVLAPPAPATLPPDTLISPAAPPPAPLAPPAPAPQSLTPSGIAGKPAIPAQPSLRNYTPPPPPPAVDDGFKLPVGSWGDHFQE